MARQYTTLDELKSEAGGAARFRQVTGITADDDPRLDAANAYAVDLMESYVSKRYATPLDAPLPETIQRALLAFELERLSASADRRPPSIPEIAEKMEGFLAKIAAGKAAITDPDPTTPGGTSTFEVAFSRPKRVFDFDDPTSEGAKRMKPI